MSKLSAKVVFSWLLFCLLIGSVVSIGPGFVNQASAGEEPNAQRFAQAGAVGLAAGDASVDATSDAASPSNDSAAGGLATQTPPRKPGAVGRWLIKVTPNAGVPVIDQSVATLLRSIGQIIDGMIKALPKLFIAIILLFLVAFVAKFAGRIVRRVARKSKLRESLVDLFVIFAKVGIWLVGLATAAGIVFPEFGLGQVMATAGLASIAVGFAFKDIFENFFAGILILWRFPFENGDFIEVDGELGRVEEVELRMTRIRRTDGELLLIPNGKIFKEKVRVVTEQAEHRMDLPVGVAYGEDVGEARGVILDAVKKCSSIGRHAEPEVLLSGFGSSSVDFDVLWWCDAKPLASRRSRDEVIEAIKSALDEAGIEIPYPYRTLTFSKNEPDIIQAVAGRRGGGAEADRDS